MKFSVLLFVLMIKIKLAVKKYSALKDKIKENNFTILIKTSDNKLGRFFIFSNGTVSSGNVKRAKSPDVSLVWENADTGFRVMIKQKDEAFMKAILKGLLTIQGDANLLPVFMKIVKGAMQGNN
jgi:hypothetical protein